MLTAKHNHHLKLPFVPLIFTMMSKPILASSLGLLAHQLLFIRGEWHLTAPTVLSVHVVLALLLIGTEIRFDGNVKSSNVYGLDSIICYLISLFTSIAVYRIYFHRLRHFPGPRFAAVSKLWHVWQCRDSRNHLLLERLSKEYGNFVRTGTLRLTQSFLTPKRAWLNCSFRRSWWNYYISSCRIRSNGWAQQQ